MQVQIHPAKMTWPSECLTKVRKWLTGRHGFHCLRQGKEPANILCSLQLPARRKPCPHAGDDVDNVIAALMMNESKPSRRTPSRQTTCTFGDLIMRWFSLAVMFLLTAIAVRYADSAN